MRAGESKPKRSQKAQKKDMPAKCLSQYNTTSGSVAATTYTRRFRKMLSNIAQRTNKILMPALNMAASVATYAEVRVQTF
jgi:hypothetical protein